MVTPSANPTPITPPRVPLIDERTGLIDRAWYMFFLSLFKAAQIALDEQVEPNSITLVASLDEALRRLAQELQTQPSSVLEQVQPFLDGIAQRLNTLPEPNAWDAPLRELRQMLETLPRPELGTMAALQQANVPWLTFDTTPQAVPTDVGTVFWDGGTTLGVQMTPNVLMKVGETEYIYVKASAAITKGQVCYHTGAVGSSGVTTVAPAPIGLTDPNQIVGIAAESIALNDFGLIQISGDIKGFDTTGSSVGETWADGDPLYYNPAYVGSMTKVKPSAPNQKTYMGEVINAGSGGSGSMHIRIVQGSVLGGTDSNVQFGTIANGDMIQYDGTAQYWRNRAVDANRVLYTDANKVLSTSANLTFDGTTLTANAVSTPSVIDSSLTATRVVFAGTGGELTDNANFVFDSANTAVVVGNTAAIGQSGIQLYGPDNSATLRVARYSDDTSPANIVLRKTRGTTVGSFTTLQNNDLGGSLIFQGSNGTAYGNLGAVSGHVDGAPGAGSTPGALVFATTPSGSTVSTERARIDATGNFQLASGNFWFTGTAQRITGDFSNATSINRLSFQTSTTNGNTILQAFPNGTATISTFVLFGGTDPTNTNNLQLLNTGINDARIAANAAGTGTYLPMTFYTGGNEAMRITTNRDVGIGTTSPQNRLAVNGNANIGDGTNRTPDANWSGQLNVVGNGYRGGFSLDGTAMWVGHNSSARALIFATDETERMRITGAGNIVAGASAALATTATNGFLYVPTCAGTPTGTPTAITGMAPIVVDTANNKLYFYSGGAWRDAGP